MNGDRPPLWLRRAPWAAAALTAAILAWELAVLRPGYGVGDETQQIRQILSLEGGAPIPWLWARGSLQRVGLWLWLELCGNGLRRLHVPGPAVVGLEAVLLWRLARRWFSEEAACWAVLADLLCAATWMRARSVLSYTWLPMELTALALLSARVRGRWGALLWGAAAGILALDYEGALAALPGLFIACAWREPGFRARAVLAATALGATLAVLAAAHPGVLRAYVGLRLAVNLGGGVPVVGALGHNLLQLLVGGRPMPYLGVDGWPAVALWSLPFIAAGALGCGRDRAAGVALWAATAVLATQTATAPWGVPAHRLAAAWPTLCLLAGTGGARVRARLGSVPAAVWLAFLALGVSAEANAYFRHMAFHGRELYGRSEDLARACGDARRAESSGAGVSTALLETRSRDVRFFLGPRPESRPGAGLWVFLPPEFHEACAGVPARVGVYRVSPRDVPVLVLVVHGPTARRFSGIEGSLRPLLDSDGAGSERAWLARGGDPWARAAVLDRYLRRLWRGLPFTPGLLHLALAAPFLTPGPPDLLARYLTSRDPRLAERLVDAALTLDPGWGPALGDRVAILRAEGRPAAAEAAARARDAGLAAGAWRTYD